MAIVLDTLEGGGHELPVGRWVRQGLQHLVERLRALRPRDRVFEPSTPPRPLSAVAPVTVDDALHGGPAVLRRFAREQVAAHRIRQTPPFAKPIAAARAAFLAHLLNLGITGRFSEAMATRAAVAVITEWLTHGFAVPAGCPALYRLLAEGGLGPDEIPLDRARAMSAAIITAWVEEPDGTVRVKVEA
jgi:hypothetical protein